MGGAAEEETTTASASVSVEEPKSEDAEASNEDGLETETLAAVELSEVTGVSNAPVEDGPEESTGVDFGASPTLEGRSPENTNISEIAPSLPEEAQVSGGTADQPYVLQEAEPEEDESHDSGFKVKIRRPKLRE
jgi:hypothetical protein